MLVMYHFNMCEPTCQTIVQQIFQIELSVRDKGLLESNLKCWFIFHIIIEQNILSILYGFREDEK